MALDGEPARKEALGLVFGDVHDCAWRVIFAVHAESDERSDFHG
jgi:hypothetical protein